MTAMMWFKHPHNDSLDPKFKVIALQANSTRAVALSVWNLVQELSSANDDRGSVLWFDPHVIAAGLDLAVDEVLRIWDAFIARGMIAGDRIADWNRRQGCAAATSSNKKRAQAAERQRRCRRAKALSASTAPGSEVELVDDVTHVTLSERDKSVTVTHDMRDKSVTSRSQKEEKALSAAVLDRDDVTRDERDNSVTERDKCVTSRTEKEEEGESQNNRVSATSLESVTAREGARVHERLSESDPDVPSGAARPLATAVASEDQPPQPREPDTYDAGIKAAKRDNMLATLRGAIRLLRWGEAERDFIEALQKITADEVAWANRSKADKQTLTQLRKAAAEYSAQHGPIQALARTRWVPTEDPHDAREALREFDHILAQQREEDWEQRRSRAARPVAAAPVLEPSCAA
jgi:hypothetical protein